MYDQNFEHDTEEPNVIETESKEPPPKSKEDENDDNDKSILNVEDLLDDDCHDTNTGFKDVMKIEKPKPANQSDIKSKAYSYLKAGPCLTPYRFSGISNVIQF